MTEDRRQKTKYRRKTRDARRRAMTLIEIIVSLAIMAVIFAVIVPQFAIMRNNWDSKQAAAETLQNGRILTDHLNRNLSKAVKITAVSDSSTADGYIQFQDNDGNNLRYEIVSSYVQFGVVGGLSDLAGPVSQLQFSCYDACDLDTPLSTPIDANTIRFVEAETTLTNSASMGQDKTLIASAYLRTNWSSGCDSDANLIGWWKLDETSGLTAADSSVFGNDGTLTNMVGDEWTDGPVDGALDFDGNNDYVSIGDAGSGIKTIAFWMRSIDDTVEVRVSQNHDDAEESDGQDVYLENQKIELGQMEYVGARFLNVTIPQGATITNAYVEMKAADSSTESTDLTIWGQDTDDTATFTETSGNISNRAQTTASVTWNNVPNWTLNQYYQTPDITSIVQEIVNRPGWSSGNSMVIMFESTDLDGKRLAVAHDHDDSSSDAPLLHIDIEYSSKVIDLDGRNYIEIDAGEISAVGFPGTTTIYVDGEVGTTVTTAWHHVAITDTTGVDASALDVGRVSTDYFDGVLDDVRIYNRALGADEIVQLAAAGGVLRLPTWTSGLSHTAPTGLDRLLVLTAHVEDNDADMDLQSVTYGGQSMTKVVERETQESSNRAYVVAYILDEAGIDAASGNTFSPSWSSTPDKVAYSSVFLSNVNQTTPTNASASNGTNTAYTISTSALSTNDDDMVIVAGTAGNTGTYSVNNGFTKAIELSLSGSDGVAGYKSADGSSETPSITHSNPYRQVIIGFVVQATDQSSDEEIRP